MDDNMLIGTRKRKLLKSGPSRRTVLKAARRALASTTVFAPAVLRADNLVIKIGHISPQTGPMAGFAEAQDWTLAGIRKVLGAGPSDRRQDLQGRDHHQRQPDRREPHGRSRQRTHPQGEGRHHHRVERLDRLQPDRQRRRAQRGALHHDGQSLGIVLLRPQSAEGGLYLDLSFLLGPRCKFSPPSSAFGRTKTPTRSSALLFNTAQDDNFLARRVRPGDQEGGLHRRRSGPVSRPSATISRRRSPPSRRPTWISSPATCSRPTSPVSTISAPSMGYQPKIITLGKAFLFPSDVASLGPRGVGVTSEVWWTPRPSVQVEPDRHFLQGPCRNATRRTPASIGPSRSRSSMRCSRW